MHRPTLKAVACSLLAIALLAASSQYLAHFHVRAAVALSAHVEEAAHVEKAAHVDKAAHHTSELCGLCLQFDRLPAPPCPQALPDPAYSFVAVVDAPRVQRPTDLAPYLWPPARAPPA